MSDYHNNPEVASSNDRTSRNFSESKRTGDDPPQRGSRMRRSSPDHGVLYLPSGSEPSSNNAPQALDHFKRGYHERASLRSKDRDSIHLRYPDEQQQPGDGSGRRPSSWQHNSFNSTGSNSYDDRHRGPPPSSSQQQQHGAGPYNNDNNRRMRHSSWTSNSGSSHHLNSSNNFSDSFRRKSDQPMILQGGFNVTEWVDRNAHHPRPDQVLDQARQEFPGAFGSGKAMTAILSSAARKRHIRLARACWDHMDQAGMDKNVFHYNAMISVFEKDRKLGEALNLLKEMERKNISKNEVTFSSAISACEKTGQWRVAIDLLDQMEREGVGRSTIAYNAAISACEKGMVPAKACEVFERMKRAKIEPSVVSYSALISAAEKGGQWKLALEILDEMKQAGFTANVVAYSAAISAVAKSQQWEIALRLFREIQASGGQPSIITYNATMTALEKGMQWERALDLFEEMKMKNMPVTVVSYGSAISACDKGLQYRQCLEFLDEMGDMGIEKNVIVFGAAMSCMEKCCRPDISFQLMEMMKLEGVAPNVHIYNSVISACARCSMWEKGLALFEEMDELGVRKDVVTYNAVLDAVSSQIRLGRRLFEEGVEKGFYAQVSRLGEHWFELDLHFLSLGGGEIALGWWFEECLVPYLMDTSRLGKVQSITIVTGYGKTRTRGRRQGNDGMKKRVQAMLRYMGIKELPQENAGRVRIDKDALIAEVEKNGGHVNFDLDAYVAWKERETTANQVPDVPQKVRARFKPRNPGTSGPPFERIESESTSPEYRLEARQQMDGREQAYSDGYEQQRSQRGGQSASWRDDARSSNHSDRYNDDSEFRRDSLRESHGGRGRAFDGNRRGSYDNGDHGARDDGGHYGDRRDSRVSLQNYGPPDGHDRRFSSRERRDEQFAGSLRSAEGSSHFDPRSSSGSYGPSGGGRHPRSSMPRHRDQYDDRADPDWHSGGDVSRSFIDGGNRLGDSPNAAGHKRGYDDFRSQQHDDPMPQSTRGYSLDPPSSRRRQS